MKIVANYLGSMFDAEWKAIISGSVYGEVLPAAIPDVAELAAETRLPEAKEAFGVGIVNFDRSHVSPKIKSPCFIRALF